MMSKVHLYNVTEGGPFHLLRTAAGPLRWRPARLRRPAREQSLRNVDEFLRRLDAPSGVSQGGPVSQKGMNAPQIPTVNCHDLARKVCAR
jgi:hypothetical protein